MEHQEYEGGGGRNGGVEEVEGVVEHGDGRWQAERRATVVEMETIGGKRKG